MRLRLYIIIQDISLYMNVISFRNVSKHLIDFLNNGQNRIWADDPHTPVDCDNRYNMSRVMRKPTMSLWAVNRSNANQAVQAQKMAGG